MSDGHPDLKTEERKELQPQAPTGTDLGVIVAPLVRYTTEIAGGYEPSAPVRIPNREELTVRLVNISQLQHLDELRSDVTLLQTILGAGIGGVIGFLTNIFTSNQGMDKQSGVFLVLLAGVAAVFGLLARRAGKRSADLRRTLLDETPKRTSEN